ncbi:MAG TPA: protein kinase [Kofleriaceae bacterium]|nr:protein kinase [Kofleriaceae bacterium]
MCLAATPPAHGCDEARRELCPPEQPQGYDLGEQLGRGGMGVVYRARQHNPRREVALKKLLAGEHATLEERRRFVTEIESAARVRHPNIVEIYDVSRPDEPPYFTIDATSGSSQRRSASSWTV